MAQANQYQLTLSNDELTIVKDAIAALRATLQPHLKSLSSDERRGLPKMGARTVDFVTKAREYGVKYPSIVPGFLSMELFEEDLKNVDILQAMQRELQPLLANLDDTLLLAGSEAYQAALILYRSVKMAADSGLPDAKTIRDDLAKRFPSAPRSSTPSEVVEGL
ncbi:hypothetical protein KOI40_05100 [Aestuariicella sp. G3-2]|uniref:hypothetical protein n=1 Tax=Pseudomaricurvus albidus TaxID=2842452 RepID=UPI001C0D229D|nr:hypothetical protein [Aestuariicella albida]MBU3069187.1 hypothetical protein [Aestuariicella albida]